jgi:hypothetical protein
METTFLLVGLVVFSFAISRLLARYATRFFLVSGVEYIALGLILGSATGVLDYETLHRFDLLINLLLGLVGFILGLRARSTLEAPRVAVAGFVSAGVVLVVVAGISLVFVEALRGGASEIVYVMPLEWAGESLLLQADPENLRLAGTIGCCAAASSQSSITESARLLRARGPALDTLKVLAVSSQILAVGVFGMVMASARATEAADELRLPVWGWAIGIALFGALCGLLFSRFAGAGKVDMRVYIAAVGVVTFASGIGVALGVSPLVVNLIAGMFVSFTSPHAGALEQTLIRLRHPILALIRLFAGAAWVMARGFVWILIPVYAIVRLLMRRAASHASVRLFAPRGTPSPPRLGVALIGQGGITAAIALSFAMRFDEHAGAVLTVVLGGLILSDLWSHRAVRRVLADAGELHVVDQREVEAEVLHEAADTSIVSGRLHSDAHEDHERSGDHR